MCFPVRADVGAELEDALLSWVPVRDLSDQQCGGCEDVSLEIAIEEEVGWMDDSWTDGGILCDLGDGGIERE